MSARLVLSGATLLLAVSLLATGCGGDDRPCLRSHQEPITFYIKSGGVMVPFTTRTTVCDEYGEAPK